MRLVCVLVRERRAVRHPALLMGKKTAMGKFRWTIVPASFPIAWNFPIKTG